MTVKSHPKIWFFRAFFLAAVFFFFLSDLSLAGTRRVRVEWVPDGDTVILATGESVRLLGVDAPETAHDGGPAQFYAHEAREALRAMVGNKTLTLETGTPEKDRFKRILGLLYLPDGTFVNAALVRKGLAFYFHFPTHPKGLRESLVAAQKQAMSEDMGFWPRILGLVAAKKPWVGNQRSGRVVPEGHASAKKINKMNRVYFSSLTEAYAQGYAPARNATPWPLAGE
ncbi:MAG: thermonuclease family protein [Thermodesulfobacteriota bacterium]|nr:thermonuclease family protein [Thermodesulfobacteriota bacterium]